VAETVQDKHVISMLSSLLLVVLLFDQ